MLGLLTDALDASYQSTILEGAAEAAREHGAGLLCFATGVLRSVLPESSQRNVLLDLVGPHNVDGLIVMTGSLGNQVGTEVLGTYLERYRPLPLCSVAVELPGTFNVLVDNEGGIWEAMQHLVSGCERRRIAFVRGPVTNVEAERRYRAYLDGVARLGLPIDPILVAQGDFTRESGAAAARSLLSADPDLWPDAIVVADDLMALGVLDTLLDREIGVPDQIALVGFNDIEESRFAPVPLTTVRQPLYEQGRRAVLALLSILDGATEDGRLVLSTELVRRRSSGLRQELSPPEGPEDPEVDQEIDQDDTQRLPTLLDTHREQTLDQVRHALTTPSRRVSDAWAPRLFEAFNRDLAGRTQGAFEQSVREMVSQVLLLNTDETHLQDAVSILRRQALSLMDNAEHRRFRVEDLAGQARITITERIEHAQALHRLRAQSWVRRLSQSIAALVSAFDVDSLLQTLTEQLPRLSIASCYLSLHAQGDHRAELLLAFDANRPSLQIEGRPQFDTRALVPDGVLDPIPRTFVVESLFFGQRPLGLVLFEFGPRDGSIYEALRDQISAALRGSQLEARVAALEECPRQGERSEEVRPADRPSALLS